MLLLSPIQLTEGIDTLLREHPQDHTLGIPHDVSVGRSMPPIQSGMEPLGNDLVDGDLTVIVLHSVLH